LSGKDGSATLEKISPYAYAPNMLWKSCNSAVSLVKCWNMSQLVCQLISGAEAQC